MKQLCVKVKRLQKICTTLKQVESNCDMLIILSQYESIKVSKRYKAYLQFQVDTLMSLIEA